MFCPLCKAEFRDGFTQCSDCRIPLVRTKKEADDRAVPTVWKGGNKHQFETVLAALQDAQIPLRFREHLNTRSAAQASLLNNLLPFGRRREISDTMFEVKVLAQDADHAHEAIDSAVADPEDEDE